MKSFFHIFPFSGTALTQLKGIIKIEHVMCGQKLSTSTSRFNFDKICHYYKHSRILYEKRKRKSGNRFQLYS